MFPYFSEMSEADSYFFHVNMLWKKPYGDPQE